jgi:hypothetical protein
MNEHAPFWSRELPTKHSAVVLIVLSVITVGVITLVAWPVEEVDFARADSRVFSQNGEDGVIERIFQIIEPTNHFAVEFGAADGIRDSNIRNLIVNKGWGALMIEGDDKEAEKLIENYADNPKVKGLSAFVYPGNVELLFEDNRVPLDLDLISIDIDSNDWYVWRALHDYRPKVVVIEYNPSFPPPIKAVVDFHPLNYWDQSDYYGASIQSLYELGKKKGYELVYCESQGTNLFFVDARYFKRFGITDNSPKRLYRVPTYGIPGSGRAPNGLGHPAWDVFMVRTATGGIQYPFRKDLTWDHVVIKKRFVPR